MVNPIITNTAQNSPGFFGRFFGFLIKYKIASILVIFAFISILSFGFSTGDWSGAFLKFGEELINPLQDASNRITALNEGVDGVFDSLGKYFLLFFAFYKIYLWFWLIMFLVNWKMEGTNSPDARYSIGFLIFVPLFLSISSYYSSYVLGESMFYPFTLISNIFDGLIQLFLNPQWSWKFNIFGESVNTCVDSVCMP